MIYDIKVDGLSIIDPSPDNVLISPTLELELGTAGSLSFSMGPLNVFAGLIIPMKSDIEVIENNKIIWCGRVISVSTDIYGQKSVECEGALSFLRDSVSRLKTGGAKTARIHFQRLINEHNQQVLANRKFTMGNIEVDATKSLDYDFDSYEIIADVIEDLLLDTTGGYLEVRKENNRLYLDWKKDPKETDPLNTKQIVKYGVNLVDIEDSIDWSECATLVLPLGATITDAAGEQPQPNEYDSKGEPLTICSVNDGVDVVYFRETAELYGKITKIVQYNDIKSASELYTKGMEELTNLQFSSHTIECNAVDLTYLGMDIPQVESSESSSGNSDQGNASSSTSGDGEYDIELGDISGGTTEEQPVAGSPEQFVLGHIVRVISSPHLIDKKYPISKISIDLALGTKKITLGTVLPKTLTDIAAKTSNKVTRNPSGNNKTPGGGGGSGGGDNWIHQVDGVTLNTGTVNFVTSILNAPSESEESGE